MVRRAPDRIQEFEAPRPPPRFFADFSGQEKNKQQRLSPLTIHRKEQDTEQPDFTYIEQVKPTAVCKHNPEPPHHSRRRKSEKSCLLNHLTRMDANPHPTLQKRLRVSVPPCQKGTNDAPFSANAPKTKQRRQGGRRGYGRPTRSASWVGDRQKPASFALPPLRLCVTPPAGSRHPTHGTRRGSQQEQPHAKTQSASVMGARQKPASFLLPPFAPLRLCVTPPAGSRHPTHGTRRGSQRSHAKTQSASVVGVRQKPDSFFPRLCVTPPAGSRHPPHGTRRGSQRLFWTKSLYEPPLTARRAARPASRTRWPRRPGRPGWARGSARTAPILQGSVSGSG